MTPAANVVTGAITRAPSTLMVTPAEGLGLFTNPVLLIASGIGEGVNVTLARVLLELVWSSVTRNCAAVATRIASFNATLIPEASLVAVASKEKSGLPVWP